MIVALWATCEFMQSPFSVHFPRMTKFLLDLINVSAFYPLDSVCFFREVIKELIEDRKKEGDVRYIRGSINNFVN